MFSDAKATPTTKRMADKLARLNGVFAVRKPGGETSARTVSRVKARLLELCGVLSGDAPRGRKLQRMLRVGHGGTLDPLATGVLVIGVGREGCRALGSTFLGGTRKAYRAQGLLGTATDSYDSAGVAVASAPWEHVTPEALKTLVASSFVGEVSQRPPAFSALHVGGERAYDVARRQREEGGLAVELPPRTVFLYKCDVEECGLPRFGLHVECSSGTYVRSLVHDIGQGLGSAAHMTALERTMQGSFSLADCLDVSSMSYEDVIAAMERHSAGTANGR